MRETIQNFKNENFYDATRTFFAKLNIPLHEITTKAIDKNDLFEKLNSSFEHVQDIYAVGMITDEFFRSGKTEVDVNIKKDYDGVLIFAVELDNETPTRKTLADISRTFNREYKYTPVIILFKYGNKLSLSNTQRQKYKINKEGEKATKVTILRDIDTTNPHPGHIKILNDMQLNAKVNSYEELYMYWQGVFNVSVLNKSFYKELSNWYFWTLQVNNVNFPNAPEDITISRQEHNAKNIIRLLTRLLFVWFIKEKGLIPDELFDEEYIKNNLLKEFEPKKAEGLFADSDRQSKYYKAVLQNLFFATLNQEMGKRAFRKDGQNRNITNLMRYENYFKNSNTFVELVEKVVPFMNGGLFECLDKPHPTQKGKQGGEVIVYEDGFSDRTDNELVVPDYIFFGFERHVDLSGEYGTKGKANNDTDIKGLITILKSYKFTVAENTPIEEDVALDPELLGKVFENLLASYNPETKTTARKQTGSFYTPREIVNYMVDESLIAYLKTKLEDYGNEEELDKKLHELLAFDMYNPFEDDKEMVQKIIHVIDEVKILDPAVGSGAFPMGTLQKMVHLLTKLDPQNEYWKDLQLEKAKKETDEAFKMSNKSEISQKLTEINEAFDADINHPDYARKLYLIENCIFGVDIQPIAIQISKLRFFISLVVEQNVLNDKPNFGIRPLPNLESKFVCANTLIGIEKSEQALFDSQHIKDLEQKLKEVRHRVFNAKTQRTKRNLKEQDKELREKIAEELVKNGLGNDTAKQIASWDPYDQNESSPFFDMEWMFGVEDGFDIVIGNPPYVYNRGLSNENKQIFFKLYSEKTDLYIYFIYKSLSLLSLHGILTFITPHTYFTLTSRKTLRKTLLKKSNLKFSYSGYSFDNAYVETMILSLQNDSNDANSKVIFLTSMDNIEEKKFVSIYSNYFKDKFFIPTPINISIYTNIMKKIENNTVVSLGSITSGEQGMVTGNNSKYLATITSETIIDDEFISKLNILHSSKVSKKEFEMDKNKYYQIAEDIKNKKKKPDIFGKFFLYKTVLKEDVKNFEELSEHEKLNGCKKKQFVKYNKGNKNGLKWFNPSNQAIEWSETSVKELRDGIVTNSRWQGEKYFNTIGFAWVDYFTDRIKSFFVDMGPYSKNVVKLHSSTDRFNDKYILAILNSTFVSYYVKNFITNTHTLQIEDGREILIPNIELKAQQPFINIVDKIIEKKANDEDTTDLENQIDKLVYELYGLSEDEIKIVEGK